MAIFGEAKKPKSTNNLLIPIGARVDVVSGSYPGHRAIIVGHTPKKYHVRLDTGLVTLLKQSSVRLSEDQPYPCDPREPKSPTYQALIRVELDKIQASIVEISNLLTKIQIQEGETNT